MGKQQKMRLYFVLFALANGAKYCYWTGNMEDCGDEILPLKPCIDDVDTDQRKGEVRFLKSATKVKVNQEGQPCCRFNELWRLVSSFAKSPEYDEQEETRYTCTKIMIAVRKLDLVGKLEISKFNFLLILFQLIYYNLFYYLFFLI